MRKNNIIFLATVLFFICVLKVQASEVNMPNGDGATEIVQVTAPLTFYDAGGATGDVPKEEQISMITFEPQQGQIIEITFETIDLKGASAIRIYDGYKKLDSYYDEEEDWIYYTAPRGHRIAFSGDKTNETVTSESQDGKLSVCYFGPRTASGSGWVATVKSIDRPSVQPEIVAGYPITGQITNNSIQIKTKWTASGTQYHLIKEASEQAPSKEELLKSTSSTADINVELLTTFNNLKEQTAYKAYFLMFINSDTQSELISSEAVSTTNQIYPLKVELPEVWSTISQGEQETLYPIVSGGIYPYTYEWKNRMNEVVSTDSLLTISPSEVQQLRLNVTSSDNQTQISYTDVLVLGESRVATFEDNYLETESYWKGKEDIDEMESIFYSGSYSFTNTNVPEWSFWGGFGYSNETSTVFDPAEMLTHQFRSVTGHGAENSKTYAIVYTMGARTTVTPVHTTEPTLIPGVYLTNAAYTYNSMTEGDGFAGDPFKQGDYFKVIFKSKNASGATSTLEYYLADYRSENTSEHYILTDWKWFDLSPLGEISNFTVTLDGSRKNAYGLTTPAYLCMDNLGSTKPTSTSTEDNIRIISTYPNPFTDYIIVNLSEKAPTILVDLSGKTLLDVTLNEGDNRINMTDVPSGVYLLKVGEKTVKLIK